MRRISLLWLLPLGACSLGSPPVEGDLAITNVTVLPMDAERTLSDQTVVVRGGRVVHLGPSGSVRIAEEVKRIDGEGRFLLPSFVDAHVHLCDSGDLVTYLAYGVGAVRSMNGSPFHLHLRDAVRSGLLDGPAFFTTGPYTNAPRIAEPRAAIREATAQALLGYDAIKIHGPMDLPTLEALGGVAQEAGIPVIGHVPRDQDLAAVLATGVMSEISHAEEFLYTLLAHRTGEPREQVIAEATRLSAEAHIDVTPTLSTYRGIARQAADVEAALAPLPMDHLDPFAVRAFRPARNRYARRFSPEDAEWLEEYLQFQRELVNALQAGGVRLLTGTDATSPANVPGHALHEELAFLVEAGLSPFEALAAGTRDGWRALTGDELAGVVAPGAPAELVLLAANPLEAIDNTRRMVGLVRGGRWHDAAVLRDELESLAARRRAEQPFVDRLWDNTLEEAVSWLEAQQAQGTAPRIQAATLRCQATRTVQDGVPEVGLEALDLIMEGDDASPLTAAYRGELLYMLDRQEEARAAWSLARQSGAGLALVAHRLGEQPVRDRSD